MTDDKIARFLSTGQYDAKFPGWPGQNIVERMTTGSNALTDALVAEVRRREARVERELAETPADIVAFTRSKVAPMVRGLFPRKEQDQVLSVLEQSVVFLTPESIEEVIRSASFKRTGWNLASAYLRSIGAEPLAEGEGNFVGLSVETTCYVTLDYFSDDDPFSDYVVHEAAHVFHNMKREIVGLPRTRKREWLLEIDFRKRETFAYACEAFSRILEIAKTPARRRECVEEVKELPAPPDERVDPNEYIEILTEAVSRRNGWKAILQRCSAM